MDAAIMQYINVRRKDLYDRYDLPYFARQKAEALFVRMERCGSGCKDRADFEEKFASLTLMREYLDLFVEFTAYIKTEPFITL
jgi:hypothetical protein